MHIVTIITTLFCATFSEGRREYNHQELCLTFHQDEMYINNGEILFIVSRHLPSQCHKGSCSNTEDGRDYRFGWIIKCYMSLSNPPHPTAQTTYSGVMKFGMVSQWGDTFWAFRGFFQFPPLSRDIGVGRGSP